MSNNNNNIDKKFSEFTEVTSVDENAMIPLIQGVPWYNGIIPAYKFIEALGIDDMLDGLKELYLSKVEDDTASGKITFNKGIDVNDTLNAKDINAEFIVIEDDGSTEGVIQGVTEFIALTEEEEDTITQILTESVNSNLSPLQLTLGGLLNADESFDGVEDGIYGFRKSGGIYYPILIQGEGGVPKILFRIKTITPSNLTVLDEDLSNIEYLWGSVDAIDGTETGVGELKVIVDDKVVHTGVVDQQSNAIDVTEYISLGSNNVKISVTDSYENTGTLNYQVSLVSSRFNFVDPEVERLLVIEFDNNNDGYLSIAEVNSIVSLYNSLKGSTIITEFNELKDFKNFKILNSNAFSGCVNLSSVKLPSGLTKIEDGAFNNTPLLETIDLSNLDVLTSVNLLNSNFKQVGLNENINYDKLFLPNTLVNLKLKNQSLLTNSTFKIGGYSNLESIWVEDTPGVDGLKLVTDVLNVEDSSLTHARLINIDIDATNRENDLLSLLDLRGMNSSGANCPIAQAVTGKVHFDDIDEDTLDMFILKFPNIVFTYGALPIPDYYVLATDDDFVLHTDTSDDFRYIGTDEYIILPMVIQGKKLTKVGRWDVPRPFAKRYYPMFSGNSTIKGVALEEGHPITTLELMFYGVQSETLEVKYLDTRRVTNMSEMFRGCQATSINGLNKFNTKKVTNMESMFQNSKVTELDLSNFNTNNVVKMSEMFRGCSATELDLSSFNTEKLKYNDDMFLGCQATTGYANRESEAYDFNSSSNKPADLTFIAMNKVLPEHYVLATDSDFSGEEDGRFRYYGEAEYVILPKRIKGITLTKTGYWYKYGPTHPTYPDGKFTGYAGIFTGRNVKGVATLDGHSINDMQYLFYNSKSKTLDLRYFNSDNVTSVSYTFRLSDAELGYARNQADADKFNGSWGKPDELNFIVIPEHYKLALDTDFSGEVDGEFVYIGSNEYIILPKKIKGITLTNTNNMFGENASTTVKGVATQEGHNITNMSYMFNNSQSVELDLSLFNTTNVTNMNYMFQNSEANILDLSLFDTSDVVDMSYMFMGSQATSINGLNKFNTSQVTNMKSMFQNSKVTELDLNSFDVSMVTDMSDMFNNSKTTIIDLRYFHTNNTVNVDNMFVNCLATTGYAFDEIEVNKFNSSTGKPTELIFTYHILALDTDFSGTKDGEFVYIGRHKNPIIPKRIKGITLTKTHYTYVVFDSGYYIDLPAGMFGKDASIVESVSLEEGHSITDMSYMFYKSKSTSLDLSLLDTSKVTNMRSMFDGCQATELNLSNFNTTNVTNMEWMFGNSQSNSFDLSSFNLTRANVRYMFSNHRKTIVGYARTQADADKLNNMIDEDDSVVGLSFIVKPTE